MKIKQMLVCVGIAATITGGPVKADTHAGSNPPLIGDIATAGKFMRAGDAALTAGRVQEAIKDYDAALTACPTCEEAELGLARCDTTEGDYDSAIAEYRYLITLRGVDYDIDWLTEYVQVLSKAGQDQEAVSRYDHLVDLCQKGRCISKMDILPPKFSPSGSDYDPAELQAMTHLMRAMNSSVSDYDGIAAEIQKAAALAPDSPLVPFYRGILLDREGKEGAKAAFQQALALDDGTDAKVINKWIAQVKS